MTTNHFSDYSQHYQTGLDQLAGRPATVTTGASLLQHRYKDVVAFEGTKLTTTKRYKDVIAFEGTSLTTQRINFASQAK
ncbi:MAG: hypothetical protein R2857_07905 [Vampirovibrionales bacterium]